MCPRNRNAFTLIEMLVVIAIIGVLVALLLPAVQQARESARRSQCANNLKQIGLAMHHHADSYGGLPSSRTLSPVYRGWVVDILPFIEAEPLRKNYHYEKSFYEPENQPVVQVPLAFMQCPSSPDQNRVLDLLWTAGAGAPTTYGKAASGDYWVHHRSVVNFSGQTGVNPLGSSPTSTGVPNALSQITDGLSQTIMVNEIAMKPESWIKGVKQAPPATPPTFSGATGFGWAYCMSMPLSVYSSDGLTAYASMTGGTYVTGKTVAEWEALYPCAINCNNAAGAYAFHPAGANSLFCDGSVHFLSTKLSSTIFLQMNTSDAGDIIPAGAF
jgi:prepilin-type N-terminal cleavage/methylation domain-containing protein/prepilin-type processing-associated H-X9-DG protein